MSIVLRAMGMTESDQMNLIGDTEEYDITLLEAHRKGIATQVQALQYIGNHDLFKINNNIYNNKFFLETGNC